MQEPTINYQRKVVTLILLFASLRLVTASVLELGNDEAYYWLYSQQLQWNYFDHPPMVALWVRFFTLNGLLDSYEGFVRAGSVFSAALATWFLYKAVSSIKDQRAGWFAACLFSASLYAGLVAGVLIMPDSPQILFWTFCLWLITRLLQHDRGWKNWILFGLAAGLCIMSKIHGIFIWLGFGLFILVQKRDWLKRPQLYMSLLITLVIISPIFFWNLHYDFPTWRFHSARVDITKTVVDKDGVWIELLGQVLINNPFNVLLIIAALIFSWKNRKLHPALAAYNFIALPFIMLLLGISVFRDTWFHWSGPAYTTLIPLAAVQLAEFYPGKLFPSILKWSIGFFIVALIGWPLVVHYYPGTYGNKNLAVHGQGDTTLDKFGWEQAGEYFAGFYQEEIKKGILSRGTPLICPTWWGAHIEYYFAVPAEAPMVGLGTVNALHQYAWLNEERIDTIDMDTALCIVPSFEETNTKSLFADYYSTKKLTTTIPVFRRGRFASGFYVYRLTGWKAEEKNIVQNSLSHTEN